MKHHFLLFILLTLLGCNTSETTPTPKIDISIQLNEYFNIEWKQDLSPTPYTINGAEGALTMSININNGNDTIIARYYSQQPPTNLNEDTFSLSWAEPERLGVVEGGNQMNFKVIGKNSEALASISFDVFKSELPVTISLIPVQVTISSGDSIRVPYSVTAYDGIKAFSLSVNGKDAHDLSEITNISFDEFLCEISGTMIIPWEIIMDHVAEGHNSFVYSAVDTDNDLSTYTQVITIEDQ